MKNLKILKEIVVKEDLTEEEIDVVTVAAALGAEAKETVGAAVKERAEAKAVAMVVVVRVVGTRVEAARAPAVAATGAADLVKERTGVVVTAVVLWVAEGVAVATTAAALEAAVKAKGAAETGEADRVMEAVVTAVAARVEEA